MCRPDGATAPYGRNTFPRGEGGPACGRAQRIKIIMIAGGNHSLITRRVGRGMATSYERNAEKAKWCNVEIRTISTNCPRISKHFAVPLQSQEMVPKRHFLCQLPPGEAILRRIAALGGRRPPPLSKPCKQQFIFLGGNTSIGCRGYGSPVVFIFFSWSGGRSTASERTAYCLTRT